MGSGDLSTGSVVASWLLLWKRWPGCWSTAWHAPAPDLHPRRLGARTAQGGSPGPKAGRWALGRMGTRGTDGCAPFVPNRPAAICLLFSQKLTLPPALSPFLLLLQLHLSRPPNQSSPRFITLFPSVLSHFLWCICRHPQLSYIGSCLLVYCPILLILNLRLRM